MGNFCCASNPHRTHETSIDLNQEQEENQEYQPQTREEKISKAIEQAEQIIIQKSEKTLQQIHGPPSKKGKILKNLDEFQSLIKKFDKPKEVQKLEEQFKEEGKKFVYTYEKQVHDNCVDGAAFIEGFQYDVNKTVYSGFWTEGRREGFGELYYPDGSYYIGFWKCDKSHGYGWMIHFDGSSYLGEWKDDKMDGYGIYTQSQTGICYEGQWVQDQQHGQGKETHQDVVKQILKSTYYGEFQQGQKHGLGKMHWLDKQSNYVGEFKNNFIDGNGKYTWSDGRQYYGQWLKGKMNGQGVFKWIDRQYIGQYIDDKKEGDGIFEWNDGRRYRGPFKDGKMHGEGYFSKIIGQVIQSEQDLRYKTIKSSKKSLIDKVDKELIEKEVMEQIKNSQEEQAKNNKNRVERKGLWQNGTFVKWLESDEEYNQKLKIQGGKETSS